MAEAKKKGSFQSAAPKGNNALLGASGGGGWAPHHTSGNLVKDKASGFQTSDVLEVPQEDPNPPVERLNR